jgi:hypothetical protein
MLSPYRAVGIVCAEVPPVLNVLGKDAFLAVPVERSFIVYAADTLATRIVTAPLGKSIKCVGYVCVMCVACTLCVPRGLSCVCV